MSSDIICNFCEIAKARWKCIDCAHTKYLCEECFIQKHALETFKNHNKVDVHMHQIFCCKHKEKIDEYLCKICGVLLCSKCKEDIEHKDHEKINLNIEKNKFNDYINIEQEKLNKLLEQIRITKIKQKKTQKDLYQTLLILKNEENLFFSKILKDLMDKRLKGLNRIRKYELKYSQFNFNLDLKQKSMKMHAERLVILLNCLKSNDAPNILIWKQIETQVKKFGDIDKKVIELERSFSFISSESHKLHKISKENLIDQNESINEIIEGSFLKITNLKFSPESQLYRAMPSINKTNPDRRILRIIENPDWNNKVNQRIMNTYYSIFYDYLSKKYYAGIGFENMNSIIQFSSLDNLFLNQNSTQISFIHGADGHYHIAYNDYLIHSISKTSRIGKTNLSDGILEEQLDLGNVGFGNWFPFTFGDYTDIALFSDAQTETQFVMYQLKDESFATLNELKCFPKLQLGKCWKLPFSKTSIGFCLINDYLLYCSHSHSASKFDKIFNLVDNTYKDINLNFNFGKTILQVSYIPQESSLIIADYTNLYRCYATYN